MSPPIGLIVEDNPNFSLALSEILQSHGLQTVVAHTGLQAVTKLEELEPALILLDVHLPYMSGTDLLEKIRGDSRLARTKIILMTADVIAAREKAALADHVLVKPFSLIDLKSWLEQHI